MSKRFYVYSTLSADVRYQNHAPSGNDLPQVIADVFVKGGAGVANDRLITPRGVVTEVTAAEVEALQQNPVFQLHKKNGFVEISESSVDPDKAAADMTGRDQSAPIVPNDLPATEQPASVGAVEADDTVQTGEAVEASSKSGGGFWNRNR